MPKEVKAMSTANTVGRPQSGPHVIVQVSLTFARGFLTCPQFPQLTLSLDEQAYFDRQYNFFRCDANLFHTEEKYQALRAPGEDLTFWVYLILV